MLTFFTTGKPFRGHSAVIQRNALKSWKRLHPDVEVILFGDDEGAAEVCRELGLRHELRTEQGAQGARRADMMFLRAQEIAGHDLLCYANCDIILMEDFCRALKQVKAAHREFLMVGRRWDTEITEPIDFSRADWEETTRRRAVARGQQGDDWWIDYFAFSRGVFGPDFPPLVVGRVYWDNWMIWKALDGGHPVVDVSRVVVAVHQNHDYGHHPQGKQGVWGDEEARRNLDLAGGWDHLRTLGDATEVLRRGGLGSNTKRHWVTLKRRAGAAGRLLRCRVWHPIWFFLLDISRPLRTALGLRRNSVGHQE